MGFERIGPNATSNGQVSNQNLKKQEKDFEKLKKSKAERRKKVCTLYPSISHLDYCRIESVNESRSRRTFN